MTKPTQKQGWRPRRDVTIGGIDSAYWIALAIEADLRHCRYADIVEAALLKEFGPTARQVLDQLHAEHGSADPTTGPADNTTNNHATTPPSVHSTG